MHILPSWIHRLGQMQRVPHMRSFEAASRDPQAAQLERLQRIMRLSATTEFGKRHHLSEVRSLSDLQARVPVAGYNSFGPLIDREMAGERRVICAEKPMFYAISTGTTGAPKCVPLTPSVRREFQTPLLTSMAHVYRRYPQAFTGTLFYFVASARVRQTTDGTPIGFTSGFNFRRMPALVRSIYALPYEVAEAPNVRAKTYLIAWFAAMSPITVIGAIYPLALLELLRGVATEGEALARDLRRGSLRDDLGLSAEQHSFFLRFARRDAALADRIEAICRNEGGKLTGRALMPELKLVYAWTSASAGAYIPDLRAELPEGVAVEDAVYASNEGWSNVTLAEGNLGGPVSVLGHFYEFIEEKAWESGVREGIGAHEISPGKRYRIVLTTSAGLVRYDLGDTVECTGMYNATPRIHFARRGGASFNISGEHMDEVHIRDAVSAALAETSWTAVFFTAVPRLHPTPRWEVLVELVEQPSERELRTFRTRIEMHLRQGNTDYGDRVGFTLRPLALRVLAQGAFHTHRVRLAEGGAPMEQTKVVHLYADPTPFDAWQQRCVIEAES